MRSDNKGVAKKYRKGSFKVTETTRMYVPIY